jgi:hypothetical protein
MVTNDMLMAAMLGVNQEIEQMEGCETTQTNQNLLVAFLTQAMAIKVDGYSRDQIESLLKDNAENMVEIALEALYK